MIEYLSGFVNMGIKCKWKCTVCGHEWEREPEVVLTQRKGCPACGLHRGAEKHKILLEEFLRRLKSVWGYLVEYVGGYVDMKTKCFFKCIVCGNVWKTTPAHILRCGCPLCAIEKRKESLIIPLDEVKERVFIASDGMVEYVSGYICTTKKCKWKCVKCGTEWEATPASVMGGSGCPYCCKESMELPVLNILIKKGISFYNDKPLEDCIFNKYPLRPDFYIETNKGILWIECDGRQHFDVLYGDIEKLKKTKERDSFKDKYCKQHGICLIRVTSSPTKKWGTEKHITLAELLHLIEIGINSETGEIDFELFKQYDFNRE